MRNMKKFYYAVKVGMTPGIYNTWEECKSQVDGFSGATYKKFSTEEEALEYIGGKSEVVVSPETLIAYVDGSYDNSDGSYSFGAVILTDGEVKKFNKRYPKDDYSEHRNVIGEIKGSIFAMNYAMDHGFENLILHYDYLGIEKWAKGEWKRNKPATVGYKDFYDSVKDNLKVTFVKVLAHSGNEYNELADKLAKCAKI